MKQRTSISIQLSRRLKHGFSSLALAFCLSMCGSTPARADILSSNLAAPYADSEAIFGPTWIAGAFRADGNDYVLTGATINLAEEEPSIVSLFVYDDEGGKPGSALTALQLSGSLPSTFSDTFFTSTGYLLSANTSYWLVLQAPSGFVDWSWTRTNTGSGSGFKAQWAATDNAGVSWAVDNIEPQIFQITVDETAVAAPEPESVGLIAAASLTVLLVRRRISTTNGTPIKALNLRFHKPPSGSILKVCRIYSSRAIGSVRCTKTCADPEDELFVPNWRRLSTALFAALARRGRRSNRALQS